MKPFHMLSLCATWLAACAPASVYQDPVDQGSSAAADLGAADLASPPTVIEFLTDRPVEATATHLADWGMATILDPAIVADGTLEIHYCQAHFAAGSLALANLTTAIDAYNDIPGLAFHMSLVADPNAVQHPDLTTFAFPANAIYLDYDTLADNTTFAVTQHQACRAATVIGAPKPCTRAHIYANQTHYTTDSVPSTSPSVGVFMHELGHAFGQMHIDGSDAHPVSNNESMVYDRLTIHGPKYDSNDPRGTVIPAASLAFLLTYYADATPGLDTDELSVHQVMTLVDETSGAEVEFAPAKDFADGDRSLIAGLNETKWRWSSAGYFVTCADATKPVFLGRYSDLSTNRTDTRYSIAYSVSTVETPASTQFTRVATASLSSASSLSGFVTDFRQIDWKPPLTVGSGAAGLPASGPVALSKRQLTFAVDVDNNLAERHEHDNDWTVTLCLYPESDTACAAACK